MTSQELVDTIMASATNAGLEARDEVRVWAEHLKDLVVGLGGPPSPSDVKHILGQCAAKAAELEIESETLLAGIAATVVSFLTTIVLKV